MNNDIRPSTDERSKPSKAVISAFDIFESFIKAIVLVFVIMTFFFKVCSVVGDSMNNTLYENERLLVQSFAYTPSEGDIVVFHQTGDLPGDLNEPVVKRIIATSNKWVKIDYDKRTLYVSDDDVFDASDIVNESEYRFLDSGSYNSLGSLSVFVPDGYLFVMGDNRNNSSDSRDPTEIGLVDERRVLGRVVLRIFPFNAFGTVN